MIGWLIYYVVPNLFLLKVAFVQKVVLWPNLMYAAILFPVVGGLKRGFEPGGFEPGGFEPGGLFFVICVL